MVKEKLETVQVTIEPSLRQELTDVFNDMGLGWSAGVRFALRRFAKTREAYEANLEKKAQKAALAERRRKVRKVQASQNVKRSAARA